MGLAVVSHTILAASVTIVALALIDALNGGVQYHDPKTKGHDCTIYDKPWTEKSILKQTAKLLEPSQTQIHGNKKIQNQR